MEEVGGDYLAPCGFLYRDGDFRVNIDYTSHWSSGQDAYEEFVRDWRTENETIAGRMDEVDSSFEDVYGAIKLDGRVLDVAGDIGTVVRHAGLDPEDYVSLDVMRIDFSVLERQYPKYIEHYGQARRGHFLQGSAEFLPVKDLYFDCVHMRGCLDHFQAPHIALKEAYRALRPGGTLVVGLALEGAYQMVTGDFGGDSHPLLRDAYKAGVTKLKQYPKVFSAMAGLKARLTGQEDHHIFHPTYDGLMELLRTAGFGVHTEVWQKAYHNVLYVAAEKLPAQRT
jgi:ubiquinone/menaquinone biosynthesis C-methylase UbiE